MDRATSSEPSPTVLLVDDEQTILNVTMRMFHRLNCEVVTAQSAQEALQLCGERERLPELALVDQRMPEMDGLMLIEELQKRDQLPRHTYLITAMSVEDAQSRIKRLELEGVLQKPFRMADLEKLLQRHFPERDA